MYIAQDEEEDGWILFCNIMCLRSHVMFPCFSRYLSDGQRLYDDQTPGSPGGETQHREARRESRSSGGAG